MVLDEWKAARTQDKIVVFFVDIQAETRLEKLIVNDRGVFDKEGRPKRIVLLPQIGFQDIRCLWQHTVL
jgi:hypothetical protein